MTPRCLSTTRSATGAVASVALGLVLLAPPAHATSDPSPGGPHDARAAYGAFVVVPDLSTFQAAPTRSGNRCILRVEVDLDFTGTLVGTVTGLTTATVDAPCAAATAAPPGTYADTFRFTGTFEGAASDVDTTGEVTYAGLTRAGGEVTALLLLRGGANLVAAVDAQAGVGGTYRGAVVARG